MAKRSNVDPIALEELMTQAELTDEQKAAMRKANEPQDGKPTRGNGSTLGSGIISTEF